MSIRRIRRTSEQRVQDLKKKGLMIPFPWIVFGILSRSISPLAGAIGMILAILFFVVRYRQSLIAFQWVFLFFAVIRIAVETRLLQGSCFTETAWFSGVLLGGFAGVGVFVKRPFTSALVEEFFPQEMVKSFHFIRINQCISLVWGIHFWLSAFISRLMTPLWFQLLLTVVSMLCASGFTKNFPRWYRYHRAIPGFRSGKEPYQPFVEI